MKQRSIKLNAVLNVIKQSMSVLFPLITYPYVSRVLGADNLGRYSFSDSIVQIIITLSLIGIPTYAVREGAMIRNEKKEIKNFCSEVFTINVISAVLSYLVLIIMVITIERFRIEDVFILILSVNIMSRCLGRDWINTIYEDYLYISIRFIIVHIISLALIFLLVKGPDDLLKYVIIMASSELFGNMLNTYYTHKRIPYSLRFSKEMIRHLKPILILFCSSVATTIYIRSDIAILGFLRPDSDVGVYTMSSKIYTIVKNIMNAVITVAIPRLSFYLGENVENGRKEYNKLLINLRNILFLILFPASVGLFCLSADAMFILGGTEFQRGYISLQILCVALMFAVFGCFFAHAVLIVNRQEKVFFRATVLSALINISLNFVFIPLMGINGAAVTTALSEFCIVLYCGFFARKYYESDRNRTKKYALTTATECLLIVGIAYGIRHLCNGMATRVILTIGLSLVAYLIILVLTKNEMLFDSINKIKKRIKGSAR